MIDQSFVEALVDLAEEEGNSDFITQLRDAARARLLEGGGIVSEVINSGSDGKSTGQQITMDARELLANTQAALRQYGGKNVSLTYVDLSQLS